MRGLCDQAGRTPTVWALREARAGQTEDTAAELSQTQPTARAPVFVKEENDDRAPHTSAGIASSARTPATLLSAVCSCVVPADLGLQRDHRAPERQHLTSLYPTLSPFRWRPEHPGNARASRPQGLLLPSPPPTPDDRVTG